MARSEILHGKRSRIIPASEQPHRNVSCPALPVPDVDKQRRHHVHESVGQKTRQAAVQKGAGPERVTAHTFRHSFSTHLLQANNDIRTIQEMLVHRDVRTRCFPARPPHFPPRRTRKGGTSATEPATSLHHARSLHRGRPCMRLLFIPRPFLGFPSHPSHYSRVGSVTLRYNIAMKLPPRLEVVRCPDHVRVVHFVCRVLAIAGG